MTNAPNDLMAFRDAVLHLTGLQGAAVGVVGDGAHQRTGGYHEGKSILASIGHYHPPAWMYVGSRTEDYSARTKRDRQGLTEDASAVDVGDNWPHGGRAAWLRYNNAVVAALRAGETALAAVRGLNYSPDGVRKLRVDRELGWAVQASSDSVESHTHHEFYRDTEGQAARRAACTKLLEIMQWAISGSPHPTPTPDPGGDELMQWADPNSAKLVGGRGPDVLLIDLWSSIMLGNSAYVPTNQMPLTTALHGLTQQVQVVSAAVASLASGGGNPDVAPVVAAVQALEAQVQALEARLTAAGHGLTG